MGQGCHPPSLPENLQSSGLKTKGMISFWGRCIIYDKLAMLFGQAKKLGGLICEQQSPFHMVPELDA